MMVADTSDSKEFIVVSIRKSDDSSDSAEEEEEENPAEEATTEEITHCSTGQWVVVTYDGETFPGEITSCDTADMR